MGILIMVIEGEANIDSAIEATKLIDNTLNQVKNNIQNITNQLKEKDEELQKIKTEIENLNKVFKSCSNFRPENFIKNQRSCPQLFFLFMTTKNRYGVANLFFWGEKMLATQHLSRNIISL